MVRRLFMHSTRMACWRAVCNMGKSKAIRTAMIPMTTINSMMEKPRVCVGRFAMCCASFVTRARAPARTDELKCELPVVAVVDAPVLAAGLSIGAGGLRAGGVVVGEPLDVPVEEEPVRPPRLTAGGERRAACPVPVAVELPGRVVEYVGPVRPRPAGPERLGHEDVAALALGVRLVVEVPFHSVA